MSKQPLGKTLLRNVIRHTDAHNKIQEEMEMWKMREWENQKSHHKHLSDTECVRGRMHRVPDQPRDLSRSRERVSEHDDREARYWSRKLYEFKANDPDRWGHSGFKELYPEEFESDGEKNSATKKTGCHKMKKSKSYTEPSLSKRSKKSSRKKKKKKKKKVEEGKRKKVECSSSSDDSSATKDKQRKRAKSQHKNKETVKTRGRDEDSSSGDSDDERERERRTHRRKKRKQDSRKATDSGLNSKKKRRKNWKAAGPFCIVLC
ncbi:NKAP domain containing 1 isoform X2 [Siniperca chuatsi]|uniref:NKAP domain containing 1 isoform X2 n=1 Tax=Siniperca chuatsi TaxID=119488 RepID=UPI001CE1C3B6|nr:NKAP domain containing 1 isoform X2 [Siniperca chuatsi]